MSIVSRNIELSHIGGHREAVAAAGAQLGRNHRLKAGGQASVGPVKLVVAELEQLVVGCERKKRARKGSICFLGLVRLSDFEDCGLLRKAQLF